MYCKIYIKQIANCIIGATIRAIIKTNFDLLTSWLVSQKYVEKILITQ